MSLFQIFVTIAIANIIEIDGSPAYSSVKVQSKSEILPYFAPYSASFVPISGSFAKLTAPVAPITGEIPAQVVPCIAPCIPAPDFVGQVIPIQAPVASDNFPKIVPVYGPPGTQKARVTEEPKEPKPKEVITICIF